MNRQANDNRKCEAVHDQVLKLAVAHDAAPIWAMPEIRDAELLIRPDKVDG